MNALRLLLLILIDAVISVSAVCVIFWFVFVRVSVGTRCDADMRSLARYSDQIGISGDTQ